MTKADVTQAVRLCRLFSNVVDEIVTARALTRTVGDGLSRAQFEGLQFVYLHPMCCIKDLAAGLDVSHPAAVKLVERVEAKKLITRSASEKDRRVVQLGVTDLGAELTAKTMAARNRAIEAILTETGDGCARTLLTCLERFVLAALKDEKDVDGVCLHCGGSHADDCPVCQIELAITGELRTDT